MVGLNGLGELSGLGGLSGLDGVDIYINNDYQFKARDDLSTFVDGEFATIFVGIKSKPNNLIIGEVYRVPNTSDELSIKQCDDKITKVLANKHNDAILASDHNYDYFKINHHKYTSEFFDTFISHKDIGIIYICIYIYMRGCKYSRGGGGTHTRT